MSELAPLAWMLVGMLLDTAVRVVLGRLWRRRHGDAEVVEVEYRRVG